MTADANNAKVKFCTETTIHNKTNVNNVLICYCKNKSSNFEVCFLRSILTTDSRTVISLANDLYEKRPFIKPANTN